MSSLGLRLSAEDSAMTGMPERSSWAAAARRGFILNEMRAGIQDEIIQTYHEADGDSQLGSRTRHEELRKYDAMRRVVSMIVQGCEGYLADELAAEAQDYLQ